MATPENPKIICEITTSNTSLDEIQLKREVKRVFKAHEFRVLHFTPNVETKVEGKAEKKPNASSFVCVHFNYSQISDQHRLLYTPTALAVDALTHIQQYARTQQFHQDNQKLQPNSKEKDDDGAPAFEFEIKSFWIAHDEDLLAQTHANIYSPTQSYDIHAAQKQPSMSDSNSAPTTTSEPQRPTYASLFTSTENTPPTLTQSRANSVFNVGPIFAYYGNEIATYFAFLNYYQSCLRIPTFMGVLLFVQELCVSVSSVPSKNQVPADPPLSEHRRHTQEFLFLLPVFSVCLCVWSTVFVVFWRRTHAKQLMEWTHMFGTDAVSVGVEQDVLLKPPRKLTKQYRTFRRLLSTGILMVCLGFSLAAMVVSYDAYVRNATRHGSLSLPALGFMGLYSALPVVTSSIFAFVSEKCNEFEMHLTEADAISAMIYKRFAIVFVNKFCSLLYILFWLQDMDKLRTALVILLITEICVNNVMEVCVPIVTALLKRNQIQSLREGIRSVREEVGKNLSSKGPSSSSASKHDSNKKTDYAELIKTEVARPAADVTNEYLELVTQFGYITMFSVCLPLAPALAMLSNHFEVSVDLCKFATCRRLIHTHVIGRSTNVASPPPSHNNENSKHIDLHEGGGGGTYTNANAANPDVHTHSNTHKQMVVWARCLEWIGFVSIFTNVFSLCLYFDHTLSHELIPYFCSMASVTVDVSFAKFSLVVVVEHLIFFLKFILMAVIPEQSTSTQQTSLLQQFVDASAHTEQNANQQAHTFSQEFLLAKFRRKLRPLLKSSASIIRILKKETEVLVEERVQAFMHAQTRTLATEKLNTLFAHTHTHSGYDLQQLICVCVGVCVSVYAGYIQVWQCLCVLVVYVCLLQLQKQRAQFDCASACVSDPHACKMLYTLLHSQMHMLPGWLTESDKECVSWMNSIIAKLWPFIASAAENKVLTTVNETIKSSLPPAAFQYAAVELKEAKLGDIPPTFQYIRYMHTRKEDKCVRFDIEIVWAGNSKVVLEFGVHPIPLNITLTDIHVHAHLRVELMYLNNYLPCFQCVGVSMLNKPHIDFKLKIANMVDVMNIPSFSSLFSASRYVNSASGSQQSHQTDGKAGFNKAECHAFLGEWIENTICSTMLYPQRIMIAMQQGYQSQYLLSVNILSCSNLIAADLNGKSDPFVELTIENHRFRTDIVNANLNPTFKQNSFTCVINSLHSVCTLTVFDHDRISNNDFLGSVKCDLTRLRLRELVRQEKLELDDVDHGTITFEILVTERYLSADEAALMNEDINTDSEDESYARSQQSIARPKTHKGAPPKSNGSVVFANSEVDSLFQELARTSSVKGKKAVPDSGDADDEDDHHDHGNGNSDSAAAGSSPWNSAPLISYAHARHSLQDRRGIVRISNIVLHFPQASSRPKFSMFGPKVVKLFVEMKVEQQVIKTEEITVTKDHTRISFDGSSEYLLNVCHDLHAPNQFIELWVRKTGSMYSSPKSLHSHPIRVELKRFIKECLQSDAGVFEYVALLDMDPEDEDASLSSASSPDKSRNSMASTSNSSKSPTAGAKKRTTMNFFKSPKKSAGVSSGAGAGGGSGGNAKDVEFDIEAERHLECQMQWIPTPRKGIRVAVGNTAKAT